MRPIKRVIVIGLDGMEPSIVEPMLAAGELPRLAELGRQGGMSRIATTCPAQTPVAWSSFATGVNPGGHGIFDFVRRNPDTYGLDLAFHRYEQKNPFVPPKVVNLRGGKAIWEVLSAAGLPSTILRFPCTYPPDSIRGRMLSGMGVPDVRGSLGTPSFFTSDAGAAAGRSESLVALQPRGGSTYAGHLPGPLNPKTRSPERLPITLEVDWASRRLLLGCGGRPPALEIRQGCWSDWLKVKFKLGMLQSVRGMVRFHLVRLEPAVELYASPVNFDPHAPPFAISTPADYAGRLADSVGTFYTTGMVEDHAGLENGRIDEAAFLDQCDGVWRERERMMLHELDRFDEGLFYCLYDTPDRVGHMFWRFREPDHPANRDRARPAGYERAIEQQYRVADEAVGKAMRYADEETLLVVLSDHGCGSFRRGVNLNTWLHRKGLLVLRDGARPGETLSKTSGETSSKTSGETLSQVDWGRSRAYALGLSGIYLNLEGREAGGIVPPAEAPRLRQSIAKELGGLADPPLGTLAVRGAMPRQRVYRGPRTDEAPDVLVNYARGYRTSWGSALGGVGEQLFEDNRRCWAGDHMIDPQLTPGVLLMNRSYRTDAPRLVDMAPTILDALGVPGGAAMEGESLL